MLEDIRDKPNITHDDVVRLNFINASGPFVFRKHFRQGLRSHVMEVLRPADLALERTGHIIHGTRWYPKAKPYRIFRLFRSRLKTLENALKEIERVRLVEKYLAPNHLARSYEFIVDYMSPQGPSLMLCGFQEYVEGEIVDPWNILEDEAFRLDLFQRLRVHLQDDAPFRTQWIEDVQQKAAVFITKIKTMIAETGHLPDLAGVGNLMMERSGSIRLVDINNISRVSFDASIDIDDRGYPVCDKSIEALARIEQKILGRAIDTQEPIYRTFLEPDRMHAVQLKEAHFRRKHNR